jgi:hypothetical protein
MHGQAALEFALVSLLLMTLFFGVLDLGRGVFQRQDLANAAREGARFASLTPASRAKTITAFATDVAAAANRHSASLGLTATNFTANGGSITCETWTVAAAPPGPAALVAALRLLPTGGALGFGGALVAKKPPSGGGGGGGGGGWATLACGSAQPGDRLTVCASYTFRPIATRLLRLGALPMADCASVTVQ